MEEAARPTRPKGSSPSSSCTIETAGRLPAAPLFSFRGLGDRIPARWTVRPPMGTGKESGSERLRWSGGAPCTTAANPGHCERLRRAPVRRNQAAGLQDVATTMLSNARWGRGGATVVVGAAADELIQSAGGGWRAARGSETSAVERWGRALQDVETTELTRVAVGGLVALAKVRVAKAGIVRFRVAPDGRGPALVTHAALFVRRTGGRAAADFPRGRGQQPARRGSVRQCRRQRPTRRGRIRPCRRRHRLVGTRRQ
jgi:hypothetical protein